jgi:hypothetical protein
MTQPTPLPPDFIDRPFWKRRLADLLILLHRKPVKAICCESFRKGKVACKGCATLYDRQSSNIWYRFIARHAKRLSPRVTTMDCYIDFDDTLIDRTAMTDAIYKAFGEVSIEDLKEHYATFRLTQAFTIDGFTTYLKEQEINGDRLRDLFLCFAQKSHEYVFPDTIDFLKTLRSMGYKIILLSFDAEPLLWQWPKINASGLVSLLDDRYVIQGTKTDFLLSRGVKGKFIFIDDKLSEVTAMQKAFPESLCVQHVPRTSLLGHVSPITNF